MQNTQPITQLLTRLWQHISPRRRGQLGLLIILMLCASFAEIVSIGAVLPFLVMLTTPERLFEHAVVQPIIHAFGLTAPKQLLLPLTIAFGMAAIVAGVMRLLLLWANTRLSFAIGADLSIDIYRRTLYQSYAVHCARNSSEIISGISSKTDGVIYNVIIPVLMLCSAGVVLVTALIAVLAVEPIVALAVFGSFGLIYALIIFLTRKKQLINSQCVARESTHVIKSLQEGLGGIRDVLIDGHQDAYCQIYRNADLPLRRAQANNMFIGHIPRYGVEALGMLLIAALAYSLSQQTNGIVKVIPMLGVLALGAQRLLPILQQAYAAWSNIRSNQISLQDTLGLLDQPLPNYVDLPVPHPLPFEHNINLRQLEFRYDGQTHCALTSLDITIAKGGRIGFIGTTGSGKSTLLDIIMGLLQPTNGTLEIDGLIITPGNQRAWQAHIAHVPQAIFLADSSIEENIAFGVPKDCINHQRVKRAAQQAQIADSIENWPRQYQTFVGERGIRLSGGQRQRIGIARALYKQADVIVLDEATSALDNETEQAVMQAIEDLSKDITLLIIAHRLTTLKNCTQIIELSGGSIKRVGSYQDIVNQKKIGMIEHNNGCQS